MQFFDNTPTRRRFALLAATATAALLASSVASAQDTYPNKPLRWILPFAVGGGSDITARLLSGELAKELGQPVIVENRPGGNTVIATQALLTAPADGYTFMSMSNDSLTINPHLYKLPYQVDKDLDFVAQFALFPFVLVARPDLPLKDASELVDFIRKTGTKATYGTVGSGSNPHIGVEMMLQHIGGARMTSVPYKGLGPIVVDLLGGQVDMTVSDIPTVLQHVKSGKLKAIAMTGKSRSHLLPGVPSLDEVGFPGYDFDPWQGAVVRKGTSEAVLGRLQEAFRKVLANPEIKSQMEQRGIVPAYRSAPDFRVLVTTGSASMAKLIRDANIKVE